MARGGCVGAGDQFPALLPFTHPHVAESPAPARAGSLHCRAPVLLRLPPPLRCLRSSPHTRRLDSDAATSTRSASRMRCLSSYPSNLDRQPSVNFRYRLLGDLHHTTMSEGHGSVAGFFNDVAVFYGRPYYRKVPTGYPTHVLTCVA
ncbi:hypothetical protein BS78_10G010400 [Paspalum vaginatum]|nr:hypothetical protein BS78_10G010400 [Paspalum vaginatum]KAJ1257629.1 hypothetical protein BS78_10G010400 [Paspalum vaginatum]KAJ1257630.1 hypothetical protein BS78_10G010400 [Paspalum vaginatum]